MARPSRFSEPYSGEIDSLPWAFSHAKEPEVASTQRSSAAVGLRGGGGGSAGWGGGGDGEPDASVSASDWVVWGRGPDCGEPSGSGLWSKTVTCRARADAG